MIETDPFLVEFEQVTGIEQFDVAIAVDVYSMDKKEYIAPNWYKTLRACFIHLDFCTGLVHDHYVHKQ